MKFKSVMDYTDREIKMAAMMGLKHRVLPPENCEDWETKRYYNQCRKDLAKKRYESLIRNGKLKKGVTEEEVSFCIKDLEVATRNMFRKMFS